MIWELSHRDERRARLVADRHYNRQKPGTPQFVPPGRCMVLYAGSPAAGEAVWVTSWPFAEYVKHEWAGAWLCSAFRNEGAGLASAMICDALAATREFFGDAPESGLVTFIDRRKVRPIMRRGVQTWGMTWLRCGFRVVGETKGGLLALGIDPSDMPPAAPAIGMQSKMDAAA